MKHYSMCTLVVGVYTLTQPGFPVHPVLHLTRLKGHSESYYIMMSSVTAGGHVTVLLDREIMDRNIHALSLESLSSVDIIQRLRYHISSVSDICEVLCANV